MMWAAVLAAVVSILGAVMAYLSARRAALEARSITTLNHKVAALDRQAEQMREDYHSLMKAIGDFRSGKDVGSIMAAGEVLSAHSRASEPLSDAIQSLAGHLVGKTSTGLDDDIAGIRMGYRESMADIERSRFDLLSKSESSVG